jgi:hypothetical protein
MSSYGRLNPVRTVGGCPILVGDSATWTGDAADAVVVCGSHGGVTAALYGVRLGAKALIFNDAGVGKDGAGIAGLAVGGEYGVAAVAVSHESARIGDGADTYAEGVVSHCNAIAQRAGVGLGTRAADAAELLAVHPSGVRDELAEPPSEPPPFALLGGEPAVVALDSFAQVDDTLGDAIVVTGSHGGLVGGVATSRRVGAAFFNDAGVGKDHAGIARVDALERHGIAAGTVSHLTARIGDAADSFECGRLSYVNAHARAAGLTAGQWLRDGIDALRAAHPIESPR